MIVPVILSLFIFTGHFFLREKVENANDLFRIIFFILVSYTVALLSERLKTTSDKIKLSEERFRSAAENSGTWVWEVNTEGLYTYCNFFQF